MWRAEYKIGAETILKLLIQSLFWCQFEEKILGGGGGEHLIEVYCIIPDISK